MTKEFGASHFDVVAIFSAFQFSNVFTPHFCVNVASIFLSHWLTRIHQTAIHRGLRFKCKLPHPTQQTNLQAGSRNKKSPKKHKKRSMLHRFVIDFFHGGRHLSRTPRYLASRSLFASLRSLLQAAKCFTRGTQVILAASLST